MRELPGGIRIYQGETVAGQVWANAAVQMTGQFRIFYDDGTEDVFSIDRIAADATRKRTGISSKRVAKTDGWVNSGSVWQVPGATNSAAGNRGSCYVQVGILAGAPADSTGIFPEIRVQLARGYCYLGHPVAMGENVEPGPSGGSGAIREISLVTTAGGGTAGIVVAVVPTNAMWRFMGGLITFTASATVGTRQPRIQFRDNAGNTYQVSPRGSVTATQQSLIEFAPNLTSELTVGLGLGGGAVETPCPDHAIISAYDVFFNDPANIDVADTVAAEISVEEWVIPGL